MIEKIQNLKAKLKISNNYAGLSVLRDFRVLGLVALGVLVLIASWSGVRVIETNYELQKRIASTQKLNEIQQLKNDNIKLRNNYYNSDTYLELSARKLYGKAAPGERVIIVPESVAQKYAPDISVLDNTEKQTPQTPDNRPQYRKNIDAWMDLLFWGGQDSSESNSN